MRVAEAHETGALRVAANAPLEAHLAHFVVGAFGWTHVVEFPVDGVALAVPKGAGNAVFAEGAGGEARLTRRSSRRRS